MHWEYKIKNNKSRIIISATGSGSGKTTITCGIIKAFMKKGYRVSSFKCGPDFIDLSAHSITTKNLSFGLDLFLCSKDDNEYLLQQYTSRSDICIGEGVMGHYDGIVKDLLSTNDISIITDTPVILVVVPKGQGFSIVATIKGFLSLRDNNIKGLILNQVSESMYTYYKEMIESELSIPVYGFIPASDNLSISSHKLGLNILDDFDIKSDNISEFCISHLDLSAIYNLGLAAKSLPVIDMSSNPPILNSKPKLAVARDEVFCSYYPEDIEYISSLGVEICYFSPLEDRYLPEYIDGLLLSASGIDRYTHKLSSNLSMINSICSFYNSDGPIIAQGDAYIYLSKDYTDSRGALCNMCNIIDSKSFYSDRLIRFGYAEGNAVSNSSYCKIGDTLRVHEFHYSDSSNNGDIFRFHKKNGRSWLGGYSYSNLFATFSYFKLLGNKSIVDNFIRKMHSFTKR